MTPEEKLLDAEAQLHLLLTGQAPVVFVDQNGERVEYRPANASRLQAYVASLKTAIAATPRPGPMRVYF